MRRLAVLLMASLFLVACGTTSSPSPATPSQVPADSSVGPEIVGPVILDPEHTSATVTVGRMVVFNVDDPETWKISADPEGIMKVQEGFNDGSATFNPGAETLAPGTVTVTLTNPAGDRLVFTITVR